MADKVFVVNLDDIEDISLNQLDTMSIADLEKLSVEVLTPKQAIEIANNPENADFNIEDHYLVYREIGDEEINLTMGKDDWQEIVINKDLQLHIRTNEEGYSVDMFAWNEDTPDEERDYDNEYVGGCYVRYEEVDEARKVEED